MRVKMLNHFRLTWRLLNDRRVSNWLKLFFVGVPFIYAVLPFPVIPIPDDLLCVVGLMDDLLLIIASTIVFNALCPRSIVNEHEAAINGHHTFKKMEELETYRNPNETRDLATGFVAAVVIALLGGYLAGVLLLLFFGLGYVSTNLNRGELLASAVRVSEIQLPHLHRAFQQAKQFLPSTQADVLVTQNPVMNAFTFGYNEPYTIVLTSALVEKLSEPEIQAVIGHELGHILFGHTRIMSMLGTGRGIGRLLFYKWSRSCEYSADATALLASDNSVEPVVCSLLKLATGLRDTIDMRAFLAQLDGTSKGQASRMEILQTHPFIHNRIQNLLSIARSKTADLS